MPQLDTSLSERRAAARRFCRPTIGPQLDQRDLNREAADWRNWSAQLGVFAQTNMLNRQDVHGQYLALADRRSKQNAITEYEEVTPELLERHFTGADHGHLIGLHTTSETNGSRWLVLDVDAHGDNTIESTWPATLALARRLEALGFQVLVLDSDGNGGFHLLVLFDEPVPTDRLYDFGQWLLDDPSLADLASPPESFPKQRTLHPGQLGNWLRLPGRHHTRDHWTRVWDDGRWLTGEEAIKRILDTEPNNECQIPDLGDSETEETSPADWELRQVDPRYPQTHPLNLVLSRLDGVTPSGDQWAALCSSHNDHTPSLSVGIGVGERVLINCHCGCDAEEVLSAIDLGFADLYPDDSMTGRGDRCMPKIEPRPTSVSSPRQTYHWQALASEYEEALTEERLQALSEMLSVSMEALVDIYLGWDAQTQCYTFPERDAEFNVVGIMQRALDGTQRCMAGGKRGLCLPVGFRERSDTVLIVEGASDVAALLTQNLCAVGRPSAASGGTLLIELLKNDPRPIIVVGEFDPKPDCSWPGKEGAERVASQLATELKRDVEFAMPPKHKDVREWLTSLM